MLFIQETHVIYNTKLLSYVYGVAGDRWFPARHPRVGLQISQELARLGNRTIVRVGG